MRFQELQEQIDGLNEEQRRAVVHGSEPLLVVAGAGSGKTRVATLRIAYLISRGVDSQSIVGLTFTNKAAREMRERVHALVGSSIVISTFHSLGARVLREFSHLIGYSPNFVVYDERDRERLMKTCIARLQMSLRPEDAIRDISRRKNSGRGAEELSSELLTLFQLYQEELRRSSAMDFDDLQYHVLEMLHTYPEVGKRLRDRWRFLLVDEYQDTNDVQSEIVQMLVRDTGVVFAVGDPDQSIYSWRGANLQHILSFQRLFPNAKEIRLEKNYRSTNMILNASNAVIQKNQHRLEKRLWSDRGDGAKIFCSVAGNEREEASYVVDGIQTLVRGGCPLSEIAILYRTNAQSRSFEEGLIRSRTPYVIWGGLSFYQRREVKDILAYARLRFLPGETVAFQRIVNVPKRGIGETTVSHLCQYASERAIPIATLVTEIVGANFDLLQFPGLVLSLTVKQKKGLTDFCEKMQLLSAQSESAFQLISSAINDTGYLAYLDTACADDADERRENLEQLLARAMEWDQDWAARGEGSEEGQSSIFHFFEMMSLESAVQESHTVQGSVEATGRVTLATIHTVKGLEFRAVFLVGLEEDIFPHVRVKFRDEASTECDIEEERRLMYVAMTRAKDLLSLSLAQQRMVWGGLRRMRPSRFLYEIPKTYLQNVRQFPTVSPLS